MVASCQFCGGPLARGAVACFRCGRMVPRAEEEQTGASAVVAPTQLGTVAKAELLENQWRLIAVLGQGTVAQVWQAHDTALDRPVAVKLMHEERARDAALVEKFEAEARLLAGLDHPNLLPVLGVGRLGPRPFLVTPLLTGRTLAEHVHAQGGTLPLAEAQRIFGPLCDALDAIHATGAAHRDVKPSNVFLGADGQVTLLDFCRAGERDDLPALRMLLSEVLRADVPPVATMADFRAVLAAGPPVSSASTHVVLQPVLVPLMDDDAAAPTALRPELVARKPRGLRAAHVKYVVGAGLAAIALGLVLAPKPKPGQVARAPDPIEKLAAIPKPAVPDAPRATTDLVEKRDDFTKRSNEAAAANRARVSPKHIERKTTAYFGGTKDSVGELQLVVLLGGKEVPAIVSVNGTLIGPAPLYYPVERGAKAITVEWRGFPVNAFHIDVPAKKTVRVEVELQPLL